ncbi:MAG: hypothetical protein COU69_04700 [Candidatus Pacebacteria bacterium CG10_big_fil_rev_8_21_14_0_10_56_10]|nr:MAG: hypothetical protein COU69_04700 [Candidatus Pacebacteria bacterium CG10_big_fil_rev_8_21_14_0_10_56_10]
MRAVWQWFIHQPPANELSDQLLSSPTFFHSLRSPLSTLLINLELALQSVPDRAQRLKLSRALSSAKYLQQILELFSRTDRVNQTTAFSVLEVIENVQTLTARDNRKLVVCGNVATTDRLTGQQVLLQEVLTCLVNNAFETRSHRLPPNSSQVVVVIAIKLHHRLRLQVQDFGAGMDPIQQQLALHKGWSAKKSTGLGLWFVKLALERFFDAKLQLSSKPEEGTIAWFYLPLGS